MQYSPKLWETLRAQPLVFIELRNIESCYAGNVDIFPDVYICICIFTQRTRHWLKLREISNLRMLRQLLLSVTRRLSDLIKP